MASLKARILFKFLQLPLFIGLVLLLPAGTFAYWQAYVYFGSILSPAIIVLLYFLKHDPELIERRLRTREKLPVQQTVIGMLAALVLGVFILCGLDRRFGWSEVAVPVVLLADVLVVTGYLSIAYVMKINSYASRIIEVEEDQQLVKTGPYSRLRHPMYSGVLLMYLATPVALGSWWGLLPVAVLPLLLVIRIRDEEKLLREELAGYREYCEEVRWRLLPWVW
jgi:protein-S-isoprenylcysteine O-methyltransferase Ste14